MPNIDTLPAPAPEGSGTSTVHPAAFFDLDRTVMAGASTYHFGQAALRRGLYSRTAALRDAARAVRFARRGGSDQLSERVRSHILHCIRGLHREDLRLLAPDVLGPILERVFPEMYRRILGHEADGVATYLCSAAPVEIVEPLAAALGMSGGALATTAAVDEEGRYTGLLVGPFCYGPGKRDAILAEAERSGINLPGSYAYGDSASDLPMLEAVGRPVAVNPDRALLTVAAERDWEVLRCALRRRGGLGRPLAVTGGAATIVWWRVRRRSGPRHP